MQIFSFQHRVVCWQRAFLNETAWLTKVWVLCGPGSAGWSCLQSEACTTRAYSGVALRSVGTLVVFVQLSLEDPPLPPSRWTCPPNIGGPQGRQLGPQERMPILPINLVWEKWWHQWEQSFLPWGVEGGGSYNVTGVMDSGTGTVGEGGSSWESEFLLYCWMILQGML